ncbi:MAG: hypothetical protein ORN98_02930, partial [Alphaproteobacteria bacterium]|nr:hypothetical protein [Alphaproteobacteria bacterium]
AMQRVSTGYVRSRLAPNTPNNGPNNGSTHGSGAGSGLGSGGDGVVVGKAATSIAHGGGIDRAAPSKKDAASIARMKGYEGSCCNECGNFTLVRNGTCLKCETCGGTTGCS